MEPLLELQMIHEFGVRAHLFDQLPHWLGLSQFEAWINTIDLAFEHFVDLAHDELIRRNHQGGEIVLIRAVQYAQMLSEVGARLPLNLCLYFSNEHNLFLLDLFQLVHSH